MVNVMIDTVGISFCIYTLVRFYHYVFYIYDIYIYIFCCEFFLNGFITFMFAPKIIFWLRPCIHECTTFILSFKNSYAATVIFLPISFTHEINQLKHASQNKTPTTKFLAFLSYSIFCL
jgi:hypothetical protein